MNPADNETLTRVGPGTPMGEVFRRFWLPAVLSSELSEPDGEPVRLRILGEDLVAFRDTAGKIGIVAAYCSHRLAPLFFGRNEECGLRCVYHGWKFDTDGNCVDAPNVSSANTADARRRLAIDTYKTWESGGLIWVFMGKEKGKDAPPPPDFEWTKVPPGHAHLSRWLQKSNWTQGMEGEIDSSHISFLHHENVPNPALNGGVRLSEDRAPVITLRETEHGFCYGARRNAYGDGFYWRVTQWVAPMFSCIPGPAEGPFVGSGRAWVPIDDNHTTTFSYRYRTDRPMTQQEEAALESGTFFPPRTQRAPYELPHGYRIDTFLPLANKDNDYRIDRERQRTTNYTGIHGLNEQDRSLQESLPMIGIGDRGISDRSRENLVPSDVPIVTARRKLLAMARDLADGVEPALPHRPALFNVRAISKVSPIGDFDEFLAVHGASASPPKLPEPA